MEVKTRLFYYADHMYYRVPRARMDHIQKTNSGKSVDDSAIFAFNMAPAKLRAKSVHKPIQD